MARFCLSWNTFNILSSVWVFISYSESAVNESQHYPHPFFKCCESTENASADGNSTSSHREPIGPCQNEGSEVVVLPKGLFPEMSTDSEHVAVELRNSVSELMCDDERDYSSFSIIFTDNDTLGFGEVAFSGRNFLDTQGNAYSPQHFCISRASNKTGLVIRTCGRKKCSEAHRIPRCCVGGRSILTSPPASAPQNESLLDFCSTPNMENRPWFWMFVIVATTVSLSFYVAIVVVYILRKDKEPVLRCSVVASSISMTLTFVLIPCSLYFQLNSFHLTLLEIIRLSGQFLYFYGFSWMSVLCFDVWLNITFRSPGRQSGKRVWGYVAFTFTLPTVVLGALYTQSFLLLDTNWMDYAGKKAFSCVLDYFLIGLEIGLICINLLLFLATTVKLWIAQHSSEIENQKKTLLMYFKLFLLVGARWASESLLVSVTPTGPLLLFAAPAIVAVIFLHPIVLFFFLVWDAETKRYLATNHPRVKRALDCIGGIGCPVRKCWGLCRRCKKSVNNGTSVIVAIELEHNSNQMYVHTRRVSNNPK